MALIKCHECGSEVSSEAQACPKCGAKPKTKGGNLPAIVALIGFVVAVLFFFGGGMDKLASKQMSNIEQQVAADAIRQYEIAKRNGSKIETCVHAGIVAAAFIQAKDEVNHRQWSATKSTECRKAGMPM